MKFNLQWQKWRDRNILCSNCRYGVVAQRRNGETIVFCNEAGQGVRMPPDIVRCNSYKYVNEPDQYDMEKIAWRIELKGGKPVGFRPPKKEDV